MKAERTRKMILEKAAPLFNQRGFAGTSLADLEQATGLTKGALYGNFRDKETLAAESFAYAVEAVAAAMRAKLGGEQTNREKLLALLDFFSRYVLSPPLPGGCPLLNAAVEADDYRVVMRGRVTSAIMKVVDFITRLIRQGVKNGEFRKDTDARALAYAFFCAIEGAIMFARVEGSREPMNIIVRHLRNKIEEIRNPLWNKNA